MPLDQSSVGEAIAAQMEAIERDYEGQEASIGGIVTIVEVLAPDGGATRSEVRVRFNVADPYRAVGLMRAAEVQIFPAFGQSPGTTS